MARRVNPTLVGAFVLAAIAIAVAGLVIVGGSDLFTARDRFVLYFDGSIKGLSVGAPVTFRGVVVGRVADIKVRYLRETGKTEVPVLIDVEPARVINLRDAGSARMEVLRQMIESGLRAQLATESLLTNQQDVQLDFFPGTPVRMVATDLPYPQIPTIPSALAELQASLGTAAQSLPMLLVEATATLKNAGAFLSQANQERVARIIENIDRLTTALAEHKDEVGKTLAALDQAAGDLDKLLQDLDATVNESRKPVAAALGSVSDTAASIRQLSGDLSLTLGENRQALKDFTNGPLYDVRGLIAETRTMIRRATDTLDNLNRDPSRFLFGSQDQGLKAK